MAKKTIIYWRDIPAQVIVQRGRVREKAHLSSRFQEAIDRAAMRAGKGGSDIYLAEWRRDTTVCEEKDDPAEIVRREAERLEGAYSDERLLELIHSHGSAEK